MNSTEWTKLEVEQADDIQYLYRCGLVVRVIDRKHCSVINDHLEQAKEFLRGRRMSEGLVERRKKRRSQRVNWDW